MYILLLLSGLLSFHFGNSMIEEMTTPGDIEDCLNTQYRKTNLQRSIGAKIYWKCMQRAACNRAMLNQGSNMTVEETHYIESLLPPPVVFYGSGIDVFHPNAEHRWRKEYRMMTEKEREAYHHAVNMLKRLRIGKSNRYDVIAALHEGAIINSAHEGPNFMGWHRIYLIVMENALRQIVPGVTIPYFAGDFDEPLRDSTQSVLFCEKFFGNGNGVVTSGPYANWSTPSGPLVRNYGDDGELWTTEGIQRILNKTRNAEIIAPNAEEEDNLEEQHGGIHNWIGGGNGQIADLETSSQDPAFFNLHAYVDYIWEKFRERQATFGVNPAKDYPEDYGEEAHHPLRLSGFAALRNIDGYSHGLAALVSYKPKPTCSKLRPYCGSPYLRCDTKHNPPRCISKTIASVYRTSDSEDEECNATRTDNAVQNRFSCDGAQDIRQWVYIPVEVICVRPPEKKMYRSYPVFNGNLYRRGDIYSPKTYGMEDILKTDNLAKYSRCKDDTDRNAGRVTIQSRGLNYKGTYAEFAVMDTRLAMSNSMAYVAVKNPENGVAEVILSARDSCGRVCRAYCKNNMPGSTEYRPCNGVIRVTSRMPKLYGRHYGENVYDMWNLPLGENCPSIKKTEVSIKFFCDFKNDWPWESDFVSQQKRMGPTFPRRLNGNNRRHPIVMPSMVRGLVNENRINNLQQEFIRDNQKMPGCFLGHNCLLAGPCRPCHNGQRFQCLNNHINFAVCRNGAYVIRQCLGRTRVEGHAYTCVGDVYRQQFL
ncbi:uncharacterized protein LOC134282624 [Saccostrea cucullata]|uniref:uncharacterized protein LOC134282624 n=1 Tax=Saccostrea cuccullata TaxID=36930 RepID=UPI002ED12116